MVDSSVSRRYCFSYANRECENEGNATKEERGSEFEGFLFMNESLIENELGKRQPLSI